MSALLQHKVVNALPVPPEADSIYYVRKGEGFDVYVTNSLGVVTAYKLNADLELVPQDEAEAGTATIARKWSAQRVWQAINAWWNTIGTAFGKTLLGSANASAARGSLGLGTAATRNVGTASGNLLEVASNYFGLQSGSDFPDGTLIRTSFPSRRDGPSITLKVWGKGYANNLPHLIMVEAYQYNGGWNSTSGINLSGNITNVTIMELDGYVCFWFASTGYWSSFFVEAYDTERAGSYGSRVTSVENSTKPAGTKVVDIPLTMTCNTRNILSTTGQSTNYPMTQKATTDAINARGFADASGILTVTSGALSNDMSSFLSQTTKATMRSNLEVPQLNASPTQQGGLKARLDGTTLYLTNNGTNP